MYEGMGRETGEKELEALGRGRYKMKVMRRVIKVFGAAVSFSLLLVGCQSVAHKSISSSNGDIPAVKIGGVTTETRVAVLIVAKDGIGTVVVNRRPVGLAPQTVILPATEQGFLAEQVVVAVRFVARDVTESSITVDTVLEVTDRAPPRIEFTRDGARRVFRSTENSGR